METPIEHNPLIQYLRRGTTPVLQQMVGDDLPEQQWGSPPKEEMGDLCLALFPYAKIARKNPAQLASELAKKLEANPEIMSLCDSIGAQGPYLNLSFSAPKVAQLVLPYALESEQKNSLQLFEQTEKTMIEYSQPNTHKELHVGHMRNLCLGDALVRLFRFAEVPTLAVSFPGDVGTHVAKCLWYLHFRCESKIPEARKGQWLGQLYTKATQLLEEEKETDRYETNKAQLTEILSQLQRGEGEFYDLWKTTRQWSIDLMEKIYRWARVEFDRVFWESEVDAASVDLIKKFYRKGILEESEGAIGIDFKDENLGFCLLLKSDGNGLYATKDVELARRKFEEFDIKKNIYVVDKRQSLHFKQVFRCLEVMNIGRSSDCFHLAYDFVELPEGAMSSRKGNIVALEDLIDQMREVIQSEHLKKYHGEWEEKELLETADLIAQAAIKFGMTRIDPQKKIVFKMQEWLRLDGESGPYLQYVVARIRSIIRKAQDAEPSNTANFKLLTHPKEKALLVQLSFFENIIGQCVRELRPSPLCSYLYDLGKLFNSFYAECPINSEAFELKNARLSLCLATKGTIVKGLELLGIRCPERM